MFTISQNNDTFLSKVNSIETAAQEIYLNIVDEYLKSDNSVNMSRFSGVNDSVFQHKSSFQYRYEDIERDNKKLRMQLADMNQKIVDLMKANNSIELKYKDCQRELEMAKNSQNSTTMTARESLEIDELKASIASKDNQLMELKVKYDREGEKNTQEIYKLRETVEKLNYDLAEYKTIKRENEDLKIKIKEYMKYKELCADYNDLLTTIDNRNKQIEQLNSEKRSLASQVERLHKELIIEKDKYRQLEYEKKKIEYDLNDVKADVSRMEGAFRRKDTYVMI